MTPGEWALTAALAFLLGAIPFSWVVARTQGGLDIRGVGSGNVGATNVARSLGLGAGIAALVLDVAKGVAAVLLARAIAGADDNAAASALAGGLAVLGHNFTPFLGFKGGKGVATGAGVFAVLTPWALLVAIAVFLATVIASRIVALGSVLAALALPPAVYFLDGDRNVMVLAVAIAVLVILRHHSNLVRIRSGTEDHIGEREEP